MFFDEKDNIFIVLIHVYVCDFSISLFSVKRSLRIFIKKGIGFQFCYYIEKFYKKFLMKLLRYYIMIHDAKYLTITMPFNSYKNERQIQIDIKTLMILCPPWNIYFLRLCLVRSYVWLAYYFSDYLVYYFEINLCMANTFHFTSYII